MLEDSPGGELVAQGGGCLRRGGGWPEVASLWSSRPLFPGNIFDGRARPAACDQTGGPLSSAGFWKTLRCCSFPLLQC